MKLEWLLTSLFIGSRGDIVADPSSLLRERGITLESHLDGNLPEIEADRDRLQQVVINLLSNAAKFVPDETGRVVVATRREPGSVLLSVTDNGVGIAAEHLESVFEKFRQVGVTLKTKPKGYDGDHKDIFLLRLRSFVIGRKLTDAEVTSSDFVDRLAGLLDIMRPYVSLAVHQMNSLTGQITYLNHVVMPDPD